MSLISRPLQMGDRGLLPPLSTLFLYLIHIFFFLPPYLVPFLLILAISLFFAFFRYFPTFPPSPPLPRLFLPSRACRMKFGPRHVASICHFFYSYSKTPPPTPSPSPSLSLPHQPPAQSCPNCPHHHLFFPFILPLPPNPSQSPAPPAHLLRPLKSAPRPTSPRHRQNPP